MLDHPTLDQLKTLRLDGMAEAFAEMQSQDGTADLTHAEWLGLLVDRESSSRETKRFESRMRAAKLRHGGAVPEDVDYKTRRGLDKALFQQMLTGRWIKHKRNLMIHCLDRRNSRSRFTNYGTEFPTVPGPAVLVGSYLARPLPVFHQTSMPRRKQVRQRCKTYEGYYG